SPSSPASHWQRLSRAYAAVPRTTSYRLYDFVRVADCGRDTGALRAESSRRARARSLPCAGHDSPVLLHCPPALPSCTALLHCLPALSSCTVSAPLERVGCDMPTP